MKDMYLWLRVDDNVTEKDIVKNLSEKGVTYGIHSLPDFDWPSFRREAAKDILAGMMSHPNVRYGYSFVEGQTSVAIQYANELIKQLKQEELWTEKDF